MNNQLVAIEYHASVPTPTGWRSVSMKGTAVQISEKRVKVTEIAHIDGELVSSNMSRTGANRQKYNGAWFASQETDKIKNIGTLTSIADIA